MTIFPFQWNTGGPVPNRADLHSAHNRALLCTQPSKLQVYRVDMCFIYLFIYLSIYLLIIDSFIHLFIYSFIYLLIYLFSFPGILLYTHCVAGECDHVPAAHCFMDIDNRNDDGTAFCK